MFLSKCPTVSTKVSNLAVRDVFWPGHPSLLVIRTGSLQGEVFLKPLRQRAVQRLDKERRETTLNLQGMQHYTNFSNISKHGHNCSDSPFV